MGDVVFETGIGRHGFDSLGEEFGVEGDGVAAFIEIPVDTRRSNVDYLRLFKD